MMYLDKCTPGIKGRIVAKLESLGACSSVKDRLGLSMIRDAEEVQ
jgi:cysteine synthase